MTFHTDALRSAPMVPIQPSRRAFGGVSSHDAADAMLLLLVGAVLGPQGLDALSVRALTLMDPAVTVALTVIGIVVAWEFVMPRTSGLRTVLPGVMLVAALAAVALALLFILSPIVTATGLAHAAWHQVQGAGAALLVGTAGILLLSTAASESERRVLQIAVVLLLAGIADFLSGPALLAGAITGAAWRWRGGPAADVARRDLAYVERPLVAFVLVIAGTRVDISATVAGLAAVYCVLDLVLTRALRLRAPVPLVLPVAVVLDAVRSGDADLWPLVSTVVIGTLAAQLLTSTRRGADRDRIPGGAAA